MMKHFQQIQSVTVDLDTTNLFILIALVHIVFVFVIVSPEEYQSKEFHVFEKILEGKDVYFEPTLEKACRSLPECIFLQIKLVKKYMHMESDVRIKEQWNIPLLQSGENIQSLTNTGYWKCKTNIHM